MEPIKYKTHEELINWREDFDIVCGLTTLQDSKCGDMDYKQLAHWKDIKEYIGELLFQRKNDLIRQVVENILEIEDKYSDISVHGALHDLRVKLGKLD